MPELLKPGDETTFTIGGKALTLRPLPFGRMKKALKIVVGVVEKMSTVGNLTPGEIMKKAPEIVGESYAQIFPLMFDKREYPFINDAWIEDNLTIPVAREIATAAVKINGLEDFFGKAKTAVAPAEAKGASPSASSTTSSPPLTAGQSPT